MQPLKPNESRGIAALLLTLCVMASHFLQVAADLLQAYLVATIHDSDLGHSMAVIETSDWLQHNLMVLHYLVFIASALGFLMWFQRGYYNISQCVSVMASSHEWAVGAWFVPILNLYGPYVMMRQMHLETTTFINETLGANHVKRTTSLVGWWWSLWLISILTSRTFSVNSFRNNTSDELLFATWLDIGSGIISIVLIAVTIVIIQKYMQFESLMPEAFRAHQEKTTTEHSISNASNANQKCQEA